MGLDHDSPWGLPLPNDTKSWGRWTLGEAKPRGKVVEVEVSRHYMRQTL